MAATPRHSPITAPLAGRIITAVVFLLALLPPAASQDFPDAPLSGTKYTFSMAAIIIILIVAFGIVGIFSFFIYQWLLAVERQAAASLADTTADSASGQRLGGLNPETIAAFPTLTYAEAKVHNAGMGALECAVCICEFEDEEALRLLPGCCHVFHPECIDAWLASHVTCPVCRSDLAAASAAAAAEDPRWFPGSSAADPAQLEIGNPPQIRLLDSSPTTPAPSEADDPPARFPDSSAKAPAYSQADDPPQDHVIVVDAVSTGEEAAAAAVGLSHSGLAQQPPAELQPSSLSTDHSLPLPEMLEDVDRFTLRLPDHIRQRIFSDQRVQRSASCAAVFPVTTAGSEERSRSRWGGDRAWVWSMRSAWSDHWLRTLSSTFTPWKKGDGRDRSSTKKGDGGDSSAKKRETDDSSKQMFSSLRNSFDWIFGGGTTTGSGCRGSAADSSEHGQ